jgi:hypothetical protein
MIKLVYKPGSAIQGHVGVVGTAFIVVWTVVRWVLTVSAISSLLVTQRNLRHGK